MKDLITDLVNRLERSVIDQQVTDERFVSCCDAEMSRITANKKIQQQNIEQVVGRQVQHVVNTVTVEQIRIIKGSQDIKRLRRERSR